MYFTSVEVKKLEQELKYKVYWKQETIVLFPALPLTCYGIWSSQDSFLDQTLILQSEYQLKKVR